MGAPFTGDPNLSDLGINKPNPGVQYGGTETNAVYYEDREVGGAMYRVQNATYNTYSGKWLLVNQNLPAYAVVFIANGTVQYLKSPANVSPFTAWNVIFYADYNGAVTTGRGATASRPSAAGSGTGAQWFDTTLMLPIWSDGTNWRNAAGTIV